MYLRASHGINVALQIIAVAKIQNAALEDDARNVEHWNRDGTIRDASSRGRSSIDTIDAVSWLRNQS